MSNYGCSRSSISPVARCVPIFPRRTGCLWSGNDTQREQKRLIYQLDLASKRGIGIEISPKMIRYNQRHLIAFYQLCLERDVKLLIGSDAHNVKQLKEISLLIPILEELGVVEGHLWHPRDRIL